MTAPTQAAMSAMVPIARLVESPENVRKTFDPKDLEELTDSIRRRGIINPITARKIQGGKVEVLAGSRRYRAAKLAELVEVPVVFIQCDDTEAREIGLIENLQRKDLEPLEEAEGFESFLRRGGSIEDLVARVSKDASYIAKRRQLANLIDAGKEHLRAGRLPLSSAIEIAKHGVEAQKLILADAIRPETHLDGTKWVPTGEYVVDSLSEIRNFISQNILLSLSGAPWKKDDADLYPPAGACTACTKRTGANLQLFDDAKASDHCLDRECFQKKRTAFLVVRIENAATKDGTELIHVSREWTTDLKGVLSKNQFVQVTGKTKCGLFERALVVEGEDFGLLIDVCRSRSCPTHGSRHGSGGSSTAGPKTFSETWSAKKANLEIKIREETARAVWDELRMKAPADERELLRAIGSRLIARTEHDQAKLLCAVMDIPIKPIKRPGTTWVSKDPRTALESALFARCFAPFDSSDKDASVARQFVYGVALADLLVVGRDGTFSKAEIERRRVNAAAIEAKVRKPLLEKFEADKKRAQKAESGKADTPTAKSKPSKPGRKAARGKRKGR